MLGSTINTMNIVGKKNMGGKVLPAGADALLGKVNMRKIVMIQ